MLCSLALVTHTEELRGTPRRLIGASVGARSCGTKTRHVAVVAYPVGERFGWLRCQNPREQWHQVVVGQAGFGGACTPKGTECLLTGAPPDIALRCNARVCRELQTGPWLAA